MGIALHNLPLSDHKDFYRSVIVADEHVMVFETKCVLLGVKQLYRDGINGKE